MAKLDGIYCSYDKGERVIKVNIYGQERKLKTIGAKNTWPYGSKFSDWQNEIVGKRVKQNVRRMVKRGETAV